MESSSNVNAILDIIDEKDASIRYHSCQILRVLVSHKRMEGQLQQLQQIILVSPMGIARLMDLLRESREIVRNGE
jgi:hypothetical protein